MKPRTANPPRPPGPEANRLRGVHTAVTTRSVSCVRRHSAWRSDCGGRGGSDALEGLPTAAAGSLAAQIIPPETITGLCVHRPSPPIDRSLSHPQAASGSRAVSARLGFLSRSTRISHFVSLRLACVSVVPPTPGQPLSSGTPWGWAVIRLWISVSPGAEQGGHALPEEAGRCGSGSRLCPHRAV